MIDISSVNGSIIGYSNYWLMIVDEYIRFRWSMFIKSKDEFWYHLKLVLMQLGARDIYVMNIRCDNAGEQKCLEIKLLESEFRTSLEYTPPGTPHHNGIVKASWHQQNDKF